MKLRKRIITLMALVALMGANTLAIGTSVAANEIETSITVLDSACVDDPTTLSLDVNIHPEWNPDVQTTPGSWRGSGWPSGTITTLSTPGATLTMNVSECAGGWTVNATVTDFTSAEGNVFPLNSFYLRVNTYNGMARAQSTTEVCMPGFGCWFPVADHTGTWGHLGPISGSGAFGTNVRFGGPGPVYTTQTSHPLLSGNETATGEMWGYWGVRWDGLYEIRDTPPGTYTSTMTMTFTPNNP